MKLLTYEELSDQMSLCIRTLQKYVKTGELPCIRFGRSVRFNPDKVAKWVNDRSYEPITRKTE
jgi:excisionase family DNA binding protein